MTVKKGEMKIFIELLKKKIENVKLYQLSENYTV